MRLHLVRHGPPDPDVAPRDSAAPAGARPCSPPSPTSSDADGP